MLITNTERIHSGRSSFSKLIGSRLQTAARCALFANILVTPFLWGGRHILAIGIAGFFCMLALLLWAAGLIFKGRAQFRTSPGLFIFLPLICLSALQLSPDFFNLVGSAELTELWHKASLFAPVGEPVLAAFPQLHSELLLALSVCVLFYFLTGQLFDTTAQAFWLTVLISLASFATALGGLIQFFGDYEWFFFLYKGGERVASAGFPNRDHYASFCNMGFFVSLGLLTSLMLSSKGSSFQKLVPVKFIKPLFAYLLVSVLTLLLAVLFSYSRAAILTLIAGLIIFTVWLSISKGKLTFSIPLLVVTVGLSLASFYGLDLLIERVIFAVSGTDPSGLARLEMWKVMLDVIMMSPIFGTGFGASWALSPLFDISFIPGSVPNEAHNEYIDLAVMFGLPAAAIVIAFGVFYFSRSVIKLARSKKNRSSIYPLAVSCLVALAVALMQAAVEFNLKQPSNVYLFTAVAVATARFCSYLSSASSSENSRPPILNFASLGIIFTAVAVSLTMLPALFNSVLNGICQAHLEEYIASPKANAAIDPILLDNIRLEAANRVLQGYPRNRVAEDALIVTTNHQARLVKDKLTADAMSRLLDRPVSTSQVYNNAYEPYMAQALELISPQDRARLADLFYAVAVNAGLFAATTPSNAMSISLKAAMLDEVAYWTRTAPHSLALHRYALSTYPTYVPVLARSLRGFVTASYYEYDPKKHQILMDEIIQTAKSLTGQMSGELRWVLPLVANVIPDPNKLKAIVPDTVTGQEIFARWLIAHDVPDEALNAVDRMESINAARLDDEKPWTMGNAAYLAREKRDKITVSIALEKLRISVYKKQRNDVALKETEERLRTLTMTKNNNEITRIDDLISRGEWVLAEAAIKKLGDDPRGLIRLAEIAQVMGRDAKVGQIIRQLTAQEDRLDEDVHERLMKLIEKPPAEKWTKVTPP